MNCQKSRELAYKIRLHALEMTSRGGTSHIASIFSMADLVAVLYADVPIKVQQKITYTEPGLKGDTATNTLKPATVESGATVRVPLFINEGETIEIDTRDGSYVSRVKA